MEFGGSGASVGFELEKSSLLGKVCLLVLGLQDLKSVIDMRLVQLGSNSKRHWMG